MKTRAALGFPVTTIGVLVCVVGVALMFVGGVITGPRL